MAQVTAEEVYSQVVKSLPMPERFKLATMILNDIPPQAVVDYSEEWTEEDIREVTVYSMKRAAKSFEEEEDESVSALSRHDFLRLPMEQRRLVLTEQAEKLAAHYEEQREWQDWEGGDFIAYEP